MKITSECCCVRVCVRGTSENGVQFFGVFDLELYWISTINDNNVNNDDGRRIHRCLNLLEWQTRTLNIPIQNA